MHIKLKHHNTILCRATQPFTNSRTWGHFSKALYSGAWPFQGYHRSHATGYHSYWFTGLNAFTTLRKIACQWEGCPNSTVDLLISCCLKKSLLFCNVSSKTVTFQWLVIYWSVMSFPLFFSCCLNLLPWFSSSWQDTSTSQLQRILISRFTKRKNSW